MSQTVWTKQHASVLDTLARTGRYTAKREYIVRDLGEHAPLVLEVYDWYARKMARLREKPDDAQYPVWLSFVEAATMIKSPGSVILQLAVDPARIVPVNIGKWGAMLNYAYIPADAADLARHEVVLEAYGTTDARAFMSRFYPQIKREIIQSWDRLFDREIILDNHMEYGTIWELREEWIIGVSR